MKVTFKHSVTGATVSATIYDYSNRALMKGLNNFQLVGKNVYIKQDAETARSRLAKLLKDLPDTATIKELKAQMVKIITSKMVKANEKEAAQYRTLRARLVKRAQEAYDRDVVRQKKKVAAEIKKAKAVLTKHNISHSSGSGGISSKRDQDYGQQEN